VDEETAEARLLQACGQADLVTASALLRAGASANFVSPQDGSTPLLECCLAGSLEGVQLLLNASAQADATDHEGRGVVLCAAEGGSLELLAWLVERGFGSLADCSEDGSTPLLCAAVGGSVEVVAWLLDGAGRDDLATVSSLAERDDRGADAFLVAAEYGSVPVMRELLRRGAACSSVDDHGCGVMHYAAAGGDVSVLRFCAQELRASCVARDNDGDTPLIVAAHEGHAAAVQWLLGHGSSLSERNNEGMSALMAAAAGERTDVVALLSKKGGADGQGWIEDVSMHPELVLNFLERGL